jgi:hypothetical protein
MTNNFSGACKLSTPLKLPEYEFDDFDTCLHNLTWESVFAKRVFHGSLAQSTGIITIIFIGGYGM